MDSTCLFASLNVIHVLPYSGVESSTSLSHILFFTFLTRGKVNHSTCETCKLTIDCVFLSIVGGDY